MSPDWKLAYVARLVRSLALFYGVSTSDFRDEPPLLHEERKVTKTTKGTYRIAKPRPKAKAS